VENSCKKGKQKHRFRGVHDNNLVGLIRKYSNQNILSRLRQVGEQVASTPQRKPSAANRSARPFPIERRLHPDTLVELVDAYRQGTSTLELCKRYNLGKGTVLKILAEHDVPMRQQQHLSAAQVERAVEQYQAGDSLATIAKQLGSTATTVRRMLQARGVVMRAAGGSNPMRKRRNL
jgi:flagellar biosynthesis/type III secretory pathway chaperone